jgi:hypothetical protein
LLKRKSMASSTTVLRSMWSLNSWTKWAIVACIGVAALIVVVALHPIPQPLEYHDFADKRALLGVPNAGDVLSNLPFVIVGMLGLFFTLKPNSTFNPVQKGPYYLLFVGLLLTGFGSGYYHLAPDNEHLVWDRLPMTIAMAGFVGVLLVDRFDPKIIAVVPVVMTLGIASVVQWGISEQHGQGDLRWYGLYQGMVMILAAELLLMFRSRERNFQVFALAALANLAAKVFELLDVLIYHLGGIVSGHTLKHLSASLGFVPLVIWVARRRS